MTHPSLAARLRGAASVLAMSAAAVAASSVLQPAAAQTPISTGVYGGGTTLSSLLFRQMFDCYAGTLVGNDGLSFSPAFTTATPSPDLLPTTCTTKVVAVEGLFAAVGSGGGQRAFIANDPFQLFRGSPDHLPVRIRLPAINPPFIDSLNANFGTYPYPRVDFGASDAPLAPGGAASLTTVAFGSFTPSTSWQTATRITAATATTVTYTSGAYGAPIQIPALEVPVAIAVDVANPDHRTIWHIQSGLSPNTQAGGAIQLSTAQLCAIFSDEVTDWSDASTLIPYLDENGVQQLQHFYDDNTGNGLTATPYTTRRLPIQVVYQAGASGTTFILTNYLANTCPQLDPTGTYHYQAIFTGVGVPDGHNTVSTVPNLPSTTFTTLIDNIEAVKRHDHHDRFDEDDDRDRPAESWIGVSGSGREAVTIGTDSRHAGHIGYLAADFTQPYAATVTETFEGATVTVPAPLSASIQDENQRINGVYHPGNSGSFGTPQTFVAPTPFNVDAAWASLNTPKTTWTYNDYNVYAQTYAAGAVSGGVTLAGLSQLGVPDGLGAYPIAGTTFLELYSCYADPAATRVPALKNFLAWYIGGSESSLRPYNPKTASAANPEYDTDVRAIIRNNGFSELNATYAAALLKAYVKPGISTGLSTAIAAYKTTGTQIDGCKGVATGAN